MNAKMSAKKRVPYRLTIAIDGPAGSGKGTIARKLAKHFGLSHLDTGLLYRALAYCRLYNVQPDDLLQVARYSPRKLLRSEEVGEEASMIAKDPKVRELINEIIDHVVQTAPLGIVLDGRDIGTVILPDATCKIFLIADLKVRAQRRLRSVRQNNPNATLEDVCMNLKVRDEQDSSRNIAPMNVDESYIIFDTSADSVEESFKKIVKTLTNRLNC
jgi:cytidylate kinase